MKETIGNKKSGTQTMKHGAHKIRGGKEGRHALPPSRHAKCIPRFVLVASNLRVRSFLFFPLVRLRDPEGGRKARHAQGACVSLCVLLRQRHELKDAGAPSLRQITVRKTQLLLLRSAFNSMCLPFRRVLFLSYVFEAKDAACVDLEYAHALNRKEAISKIRVERQETTGATTKFLFPFLRTVWVLRYVY